MFSSRAYAILFLASLAACAPAYDDHIVPTGHPADPLATAAVPISIPSALEPVSDVVRPKVSDGSGSTEDTANARGPHAGDHDHQRSQ